MEAAVADHVPVAELIPHLVDAQPGEHWVLRRSVGRVRPEHSLADAGVLPGESLRLETADTGLSPEPQVDAVAELSGPVGESAAAWFFAVIVAVLSIRSSPVWNPLRGHSLADLRSLHVPLAAWWPWAGSGAGESPGASSSGAGSHSHPWAEELAHSTGLGLPIAVLVVTALVALGLAALSLHNRRFVPLAAIVGFGLGLHLNVLCGCLLGAALVWRSGRTRVVMLALSGFAAINVLPGVTLLVALVVLTVSGQIAIGLAGISLPRVPAAGVFRPSAPSSAGSAVDVHSALVVACCLAIAASCVQIVPPGARPSLWDIALLGTVALTCLAARGARPVHARALAVLAGFLALWAAWHASWGFALLPLVLVPLARPVSPLWGRLIDAAETVAFTAAVPLALNTTGVFGLIRGLG